jgi:uncharacterized repeat protein (TIGR01451 family)
MPRRSRTAFTTLATFAMLLAGSAPPDAWATSPGYFGGTLKTTPEGCNAACHGPGGAISVTLTGPAALDKGESGTYVVARGDAGQLRGVDIAASAGVLSETASTLTVIGDEITHIASIPVTSYTFTYTMPMAGGVQLLYATGLAGMSGSWAFAPTLTVKAKPDAPTSLAAFNVGTNSVDLSWAGTGPHFRVVYKAGAVPPANEVDGTVVDVGAATSTTIGGLSGSTQYSFAVFAKLDSDAIFSTNAATTTASTVGTSYIWEGGTSNEWTEPTNWSPVGVPGVSDAARFVNLGTPSSINVATPVSVNRMEFFSQSWTLSGATITMTTGAALPNIRTADAPVTINNELAIPVATFAMANDADVTLASVTGTGGFVMNAAGLTEVVSFLATGPVLVGDGILRASPTSGANALALTGGVIQTGGSAWASLSGNAGSSVVLTGTTTIGGDGSDTEYAGNTSGSGGLVKVGTGTLTLSGSNSYAGGTAVDAGTLRFGNGTAGTIPATAVSIGVDGTLRCSATGNLLGVTGAGSLVVDQGIVGSILPMNYPGLVSIEGGSLFVGNANLSGLVMVSGPGTFAATGVTQVRSIASGGTVALGGQLTIGVPFDGSSGGAIGLVTGAGKIIAAGGFLGLSGSVPVELEVGSNASVQLQGASVAIVSGSGGQLSGSGTVGTLALAGLLTPGLSIAATNLDLAGALAITLIDASTHGQLVASNTSLQASPSLLLQGVPDVGTPIRIIDNTGAGPINGTFLDLPEGAVLPPLAGVPFRISYVGGDGNDVTLQLATWTVIPVAAPCLNPLGCISPKDPQEVVHNAMTSFTLVPDDGYHVESITGCGGSLVGDLYTTAGVTADCTVTANFAINQYTVTASPGINGTIVRAVPGPVDHGASVAFTVTPNTGYTATSFGGDCPAGNLVGDTYTTGPITASCNVSATFTLNQYSVPVTVGPNGAVTPATNPRTANHGAQLGFVVTPDTGYHAVVGGNCPAGGFIGNNYSTGLITAPCDVSFTFVVNTYTVTPSLAAGASAFGSIQPDSVQVVEHGATATFTVAPAAGYAAVVGGSCGGSLSGTQYTTAAVTGNCTVVADFAQVVTYNIVLEGYQQVGPYVITPATGSGTATFNTTTKQLTLDLSHSGLSSPETMAHIHGPAPRGGNADVIFPLAAGSPKTDVVTLSAAQESLLMNGLLYVNVHTSTHPNGEIRGQIDNVGAAIAHPLTVSKLGTGTGTVTGTTEAGPVIDCGVDCTEAVPAGKVVTLAAAASGLSTFTGWTGPCSGVGPCIVAMDGAKLVSATFAAPSNADLAITQSAAPDPATVGQDITITVTVANNGPGDATGVSFGWSIPPNATFVSAPAGCTQTTFAVTCTIGALGNGVSAQRAIVVRPDAAGPLVAAANVSGQPTDPIFANNINVLTVQVAPAARLGNISTRMQVLTGNDVLIGGFVIGGAASKRVAIVATGPSLAPFGITNGLANPTLTLVRSSDQAVIDTNDDWQDHANAAQLQAAGFSPSDAHEAAILADLAPGAYTAIVSGVNDGTGVSVIGVYEVDHPEVPLINISTRGRVLTGNDVMIGGFVINGSAPQTLAIVATGPSLAPFGITSPLANPKITLVRSSDQAVIDTNDDWQAHANASQLSAAGFAPSDALEAGLYVTLPPGAYTAIVEGVGGTTGVAVVGVYVVP